MNVKFPASSALVSRAAVEQNGGQRLQFLGLHAQTLFLNLTTALERLWVFHEAMHRGLPVSTSHPLLLGEVMNERPRGTPLACTSSEDAAVSHYRNADC